MPKFDIPNMSWEQYEQTLRAHYAALANKLYPLETYLHFGRVVWEDYNKSYKVFYTNFGYYAEEVFSTQDAAVTYGKSKGLEFRVDLNGVPVCSWSPIGGLR